MKHNKFGINQVGNMRENWFLEDDEISSLRNAMEKKDLISANVAWEENYINAWVNENYNPLC